MRDEREPLEFKSECWIKDHEAPAVLKRSERTIRRWIQQGKVRSMRPGAQRWLYLPDLRKCESENQHRAR